MVAPVVTEQQLPNVELTPEILYDILLGEIAGQQGQLDVAVNALYRAAIATQDPRLAARATHAALYAKQYKEATSAAKLWVQLEPHDTEARETLATVLLELDDPVEAQLHLEKVLALAATQKRLGSAYLRIASLLTRQGNRKSAFEVMETLVALYPDNAHAYLALAHLGVRAADLDKALKAADKALALQPHWEEAALYKARILIGKQNLAEAEAFYASFLDDNSDASKVRLNYARFLVDRKQWDRAHKEFRRVIDASPDDADAILAVGLLSVQAERLDDAREYLQRHLELNPENDQARLYLGQVADKQQRHADAVRWYGEITSDKFYFEAQTRLCLAMARNGELERARKRLRQVQANDDDQLAQLALAEEQMLREAKAYHEALKVLNVALVKLPEQTDVRYARALVAEKLDMLDVAESDLRKILQKDPGNVHALNALGYTLADRTDRLDEALELIRKAMTHRPNDAFVLDSMGWVQYRLGNYAEAIRYLKKALSLRNDAEISAHLGEVLWIAGERTEARTIWRRALEQTPDNEALIGVIKKFTE